MKWPNESLRVQAYKLKKADPSLSDEVIYDRFIKEKKIIAPVNSIPIPTVTDAAHPSIIPSAGNDTGQPVELPEDFKQIVLYTQQAQRYCETWRATDTITYFKDKDKIIKNQEVNKQSLTALSPSELLQIIKPHKNWPPAPSLSMNSSGPSTSPTSSATDN
jgi:hypothetical protein